jgi:hypothetical protein
MRVAITVSLAFFLYACGSQQSAVKSAPSGVAMCPSAMPASGSSCDSNTQNTSCSFGDQSLTCRPQVFCEDNAWALAPQLCQDENTLAACPAHDSNTITGTQCPTNNSFCRIDDIVCSCVILVNGGDPNSQWICDRPTLSPSCPRWYPNLRTACTQEGLSCAYSTCGGEAGAICTDGLWMPVDGGPCPV